MAASGKKIQHKSFFIPTLLGQTKSVTIGTASPWKKGRALLDIIRAFVLRAAPVKIEITTLLHNPSYDRLLESFRRAGFLRRFWIKETYHDYPRVLSYGIEFTHDRDAQTQEQHFSSSMVAIDDSIDIALSKALGEALERDAALFRGPGDPYLPPSHVVEPSFDWRVVPQFSSKQQRAYSYLSRPTDKPVQFDCIKVRNTTTELAEYVPMQCIYYGPRQYRNEPVLQQGTTSGCGGGFTYTQAALSGIHELVERDHFLLHWFSGVAPRRIEHAQLPEKFRHELQKIVEQYNIEVHFLDTSYDMSMTTCVCIIIDPVLNYMSMGGKSGFTEAIFQVAYLEALSVLTHVRDRIKTEPVTADFFSPNYFSNPSLGKKEREVACCTPEAIAWVRSHFLNGQPISTSELSSRYIYFKNSRAELRHCIEEFAQKSTLYGKGYNLYLYSFKSPWLCRAGYCVVRAFVPEYIKLHLNEHLATPLGQRMERFCADKGIHYGEGHLNTKPHFFP